MDIDLVASSLKNNELTYPFDQVTRVYKVENKMYMLTDDEFTYVSLKNSPDKNYLLRTSYDYITTGYHLNKEHWITIDLTGEYDPELVTGLIIESYQMIVSKLPKKIRIHYLDEL